MESGKPTAEISGEVVLGEIPVSAQLALGFERLKLLVTSNRLIMAHLGKRGAGALAVSNLIGRLSGAVEDLIRGGGESLRKRRARGSTPQDILESDKDNFEIRYEEIVEVSLDELNGTVSITVLTRQEKFRFFSPGMTLRKVEALFRKTLGDKITVGKLG